VLRPRVALTRAGGGADAQREHLEGPDAQRMRMGGYNFRGTARASPGHHGAHPSNNGAHEPSWTHTVVITRRNGVMIPGPLRGRDASRWPCYSRTAMHQLAKGATRAPRMSHLCTLADVLEVTSSPWLKPGVSHPWGEHQMLCLLRRHLLTSPWLKPGASRRTW
jgi:hypothetical protein